MIPETVHQMPAPIEKFAAEGFAAAPAVGSKVEAPTPIPIKFRIRCATSATTTPDSTAPHEILLIMMVRISSAGVMGLNEGASCTVGVRVGSIVTSAMVNSTLLTDWVSPLRYASVARRKKPGASGTR